MWACVFSGVSLWLRDKTQREQIICRDQRCSPDVHKLHDFKEDSIHSDHMISCFMGTAGCVSCHIAVFVAIVWQFFRICFGYWLKKLTSLKGPLWHISYFVWSSCLVWFQLFALQMESRDQKDGDEIVHHKLPGYVQNMDRLGDTDLWDTNINVFDWLYLRWLSHFFFISKGYCVCAWKAVFFLDNCSQNYSTVQDIKWRLFPKIYFTYSTHSGEIWNSALHKYPPLEFQFVKLHFVVCTSSLSKL